MFLDNFLKTFQDQQCEVLRLFIWFTDSMQIFLSDCNHFWQGKFGCIFCVTHYRFTPLAPWAISGLGNHVHLSTWAALRALTTRSQQPCCFLEYPWRPLTLYWCCWRSPPTTTQRLTGTDQGLSSAGTWNRVVTPKFYGESWNMLTFLGTTAWSFTPLCMRQVVKVIFFHFLSNSD